MELLSLPSRDDLRLDALYVFARTQGSEWVGFLDLCFDGGDGIEEAEGLLKARLADSGCGVEYLDNPQNTSS